MKPNDFLFGIGMYGLGVFTTSLPWLIINNSIIAGMILLISVAIIIFAVVEKK